MAVDATASSSTFEEIKLSPMKMDVAVTPMTMVEYDGVRNFGLTTANRAGIAW